MWTDREVCIAFIGGTFIILMFVIAIIALVIDANKAFRRGIQWARDNTKKEQQEEEKIVGKRD